MIRAHGPVLLVIAMSWALPSSAQTTAPAQEPASTTTWEAFVGADYSVGDYGGASDTTVVSVPLTLRAQLNRVRLEATVPYLHVEGPGTSAGGGIVVPGNQGTTSRSGLGDIYLGAAFLLNRGGQTAPSFEIAGTAKIPTASSGLGTEEFDYGAQLNVYQPLTMRTLLFASAGYQVLGDFGTIELEDGITASAGINFTASMNLSVGVGVNYRQQYVADLGDYVSVSPYLQWSFGGMWRITGYGLVGLTDASPRFGAGLRLGLYG
jgi:outer membrane putative beta-barrel porin/alpha-amylase